MALFLVALILAVGSAMADLQPRSGQQADVILHGGKVFTVNETQPWAEAVAVRGHRILAVGDNATVRALEGPGTTSIDLEGRVLLPGFNAAHTHLGIGLPRLTLPPINIPGPGPTLAEALDQVAGAVAVAEPGEWIVATVGELFILDPAADRFALDAVAPDNPVLLFTWSSHGALVNTAALDAAGLADDQPDPFGGTYGRIEGTNTLNGLLSEYAVFRFFGTVRDAAPDAVITAEFEALTGLLAQLGVTSIQEMPIGLSYERAQRVLAPADLQVRLRLMCVPFEVNESCRVKPRHRNRLVTPSGVKWLLDGTPIERSAALREPYADAPGTGVLNLTTPERLAAVRRARRGPRGRNQILMHAVGDRAIDKALNALDRTAPPSFWRTRRPRIEHGDLLHVEDFHRVRSRGVVMVQNPTHLSLDLNPALGPERAGEAQLFGSLLDADIPLALGSDGAFPNPYVDIFFSILHPFHPQEAITVEQAITAYTRGSAYAEHQERRKGTLRLGALADMTVLSADIFEVTPPEILGITSVLTLVGGEIVWDAGVLGLGD